MTRAELYISELNKRKTPQNAAIVEGIIKGFSAILLDAYRKAGINPDAYAQLEACREKSKMAPAEFIESVGHTILESSYSESTKKLLLDNLGKYAKAL